LIITAIVLLGLLILSAIFAGSETALFMVLKDRTLMADEKRVFGDGSFVLKVLREPNQLLMTVLLGNLLVNLVFFALSTIFVIEVERNVDVSAGVLVGAAFLIIVILFGEIVPKTIASIFPLPFSRKTAWLIYRVMVLLSPCVRMLNLVVVGINRLLGLTREEDDGVKTEDLQSFVDMSGSEGWLEGMHGEVMATVMELHELSLKSISTPRVDVKSIHEKTPLVEVRERGQEWGMTLLPVYREHHDDVSSYIDTVRLIGEIDESAPASSMAYPLPVFSELSKMDFVLRKFLENEHRLALTVNEYGEMSGIVTWNDVMKCLSKKVSSPLEGGDKTLIALDARTPLRELNCFHHLDSVDSVTLGGWISSSLGRIPVQGEMIKLDRMEMMVSRSSSKAVLEVLFKKEQWDLLKGSEVEA
jgi:putative hemolysin